MIVDEVEVTGAERISPSFVRVELAGPALEHFGVDGPTYDQRVKLVFPNAEGRLPSFGGPDESWFDSWLSIPEEERGQVRTYTIREVRGSGSGTRLVVDFVVHGNPPGGPGACWAHEAEEGDRLVLVAPRRGVPFGGIEFDPGPARELLLVGDETAVPAVASILAQLPADVTGVAFLEVPWVEDLQLLPAPIGIDVRWLPRAGGEPGSRLVPVVRRHLGLADVYGAPAPAVDDIWETPTYSAEGAETVVPSTTPDRYAWIAGESGVVQTLRRCLVGELGWARSQVAFMGYWRRGVSMRS